MYPNALDCGIAPELFWEYSPAEIQELLLSYKRKKTARERLKIEQLFVLAQAISTRVVFFFSDKDERNSSTVLQPWDVYPELFADEEKLAAQIREDTEFEAYKEARRHHAAEFNRRRA